MQEVIILRAYSGKPKKLLHGRGVVPYNYMVNECPFYRRWRSLMDRCYSKTVQDKRPTYKGCEVCEEWWVFVNFKTWMEAQDWQDKDLDKDILSFELSTNKYSPETSAFIDRKLNSFFTLRQNHRGDYPLGVTYQKRGNKNYVARLNYPLGRKTLGYYTTPEEAHKQWQIAKHAYGVELMNQQTDVRVKEALRKILDNLQYQIDNDLITESLLTPIDTSTQIP